MVILARLILMFILLFIGRGCYSKPPHKKHVKVHQLKRGFLEGDHFQFDVFMDFIQEELTVSETVNKNKLYNTVAQSYNLNNEIAMSDEFGWDNGKVLLSGLFYFSHNLKSSAQEYGAGAKAQYTFNRKHKMLFSIYESPVINFYDQHFELMEGLTILYTLRHKFYFMFDEGVGHQNFKTFRSSPSFGIIKTF